MSLGVAGRAGDVDRRERPPRIPQETMAVRRVRREEEAHDLAGTIDPIGPGVSRIGDIDRGERPSGIPQKTVTTARVAAAPYDLPGVVHPPSAGLTRAAGS